MFVIVPGWNQISEGTHLPPVRRACAWLGHQSALPQFADDRHVEKEEIAFNDVERPLGGAASSMSPDAVNCLVGRNPAHFVEERRIHNETVDVKPAEVSRIYREQGVPHRT